MRRLVGVSLIAMCVASSASAAVDISSAGTYDATGPALPTSSSDDVTYVVTSGDILGASSPGIGKYIALIGGSITYSYGTLLSGFSLYWGSPDYYNYIQLYKNGNLVTEIGQMELYGAGFYGAGYYKFVSDLVFDAIVLTTSIVPFETSGVTATVAAVPGPVAAAGLPGALALLGFGLYRRRLSQS